MAATPEGKIKKRIKDILDLQNVYYFMPSTNGYGRSGVVDIVACVNGNFLGIEAKSGNKQPTALQHREMDLINKAGGFALCINEYNIDALNTYINLLKLQDNKNAP